VCGRYVSATPPEVLAAYFDATVTEGVAPPEPSYNVAPTNGVWAVVERADGRHLEVFRWGLVPSWAAEVKVGAKMINARAETLLTKPAFRSLVPRRRCLVPADGFYEWQAMPGQRAKQPMYIHRCDGAPLALAGLWSTWRDPAAGPEAPWLHSLTIVTTAANATMAPVHDRMPAILEPVDWARWLTPGPLDAATVAGLLVPAGEGVLTLHPVSTDVNRVSVNDAHLIDEVAP